MAFVTTFHLKLAVLFSLQPLFEIGYAQDALPLNFGDTVKVLGAMERTNRNFQDGFSIDILSPQNRTLTVQQNNSPVGVQSIFSAQSAADPFVALSNYSYKIEMNESTDDLIASIALPFDPVTLMANGLQPANTFVAMLADDKKSWFVDEDASTVQSNESKTKYTKMTSVSGEFLLVGRQKSESGNILVQYGTGSINTVELLGGAGPQEVEFIDGLKLSVETSASLDMTVELEEGINPGTLNDDVQALSSFTWVVRTSAPFQSLNATMQFPFNRKMLAALRPEGSSPTTMLTLGRRALNATSGTFLPFNEGRQVVRELPDDKIVVEGVDQLDGQFLMMVVPPRNINRRPPPP